jgi:hypothetical protein
VILSRRYSGTYGKQKNREIPSKRNNNVFQAAVGGYCITWVNKALFHWQTISFHLSPLSYVYPAPLNRVYLVKFVYDSEVYPVAPEDVTGAYFTGVPLGCSTRVKQPAGLPDEDRGFTRELSAMNYELKQ